MIAPTTCAPSGSQYIDEAYHAILGRVPSAEERASAEVTIRRVEGREALLWELLRGSEFQWRTTPREYVPAGHFYSAVPSKAARKEALKAPGDPLLDVDLRQKAQKRLLDKLVRYRGDCPFRETRVEGLRYHYGNDAFTRPDGFLLHAMLRHLKPSRVMEVGSGYSSALMLDVRERFLPGLKLTFIEPYPELLRSLMRPADEAGVEVIGTRVQDVDPGEFRRLRAGDVLFIDSTHVSKLRSDVNFLFFHVLPRLAKGVVIHFHDIFHGLEYPNAWIKEGRAWNECYLLHALLMNNRDYRVLLFNSFAHKRFKGWMEERLPELLGSGGSFWMEKRVGPAKEA